MSLSLCAAIALIAHWAEPFQVGAELNVVLWLSTIHRYNPKSAGSSFTPYLEQPLRPAVRSDLTHLRSRVTEVDLVERAGAEPVGPIRDDRKSTLTVADPIPLQVTFRNIQQGGSKISAVIGQAANPVGASIYTRYGCTTCIWAIFPTALLGFPLLAWVPRGTAHHSVGAHLGSQVGGV